MNTPPQVVTSSAPAPLSAATALRAMQTLAVALVLVLVAAILHLGAAPYIGFAFTGTLVMHLIMRPSRRELAGAVLAGAIFGGAYLLHSGQTLDYYGREVGLPGGFLGMGSLLILATKWIWAESNRRDEQWEQVSEAALIPLLCIASMIAVDIAAELTSHTFDRLLMGVDAKFGGPPSWIVGRLLRQHEWLLRTCGWAYCSLPLALSVALLVQWRERRAGIRHAVDLRWVSVALGVTGFTLYQICPASGPVYLFRDVFPFGTPNLSGLAMVPAALASFPRNAMPSLHVGWTLLLYWNTRGRAWWVRVVVLAYMTLTVLATLGSGEHYLVDLIVAPALALAIQAACTARISITTRWVALCTGATLVLAWLIAFRTGAALSIPAGSAIWTLAVWTVLIPTVLKGSLGTKTEKHLRRAAAKRRLAA